VAEAVVAASPGKPVLYAPGRAELRRTVGEVLMAGDLCCTLGAGDLTSLPDELMSDPGW
jgi:UDP-N-acetylmuramate-alanine ligase